MLPHHQVLGQAEKLSSRGHRRFSLWDVAGNVRSFPRAS